MIRARNGNTLILTVALTLCLFAGLGLVSLQVVNMYGSKHEHVNATEAAALAGAQALSRIIVEDRNVGYISASDYPPNGSQTVAVDGYAMPVIGINTLAATVRLDTIIADALDDNVMRRLAQNDYFDYVYAASLLRDELYRCAKKDQFGKDINGNSVCIYNEAHDAYMQTYQKMTGQPPTDAGFVLKLGFIEGLRTNTPIPQPSQFAYMDTDLQDGGFYKSCLVVPYKSRNFIFAPATDKLTLADPQQFELRLPALVGGIVPTVVHVASNQDVSAVGFDGAPTKNRIKSEACAYGGIQHDTLRRPGTLFLTFDGGNHFGITSLAQVLTDEDFCKVPTDTTEVPMDGDFPPEALTGITIVPFKDQHPPFGQVMRVAIYDWIRRYRDQVNVKSLFDAIQSQFAVDTNPGGFWYTMQAGGSVLVKPFGAAGISRLGLMAVSQKQWRAVSGIAKDTDDDNFDIIIKDYVNRRGCLEGGKHGGEPYPWKGGEVAIVTQPRQIDDETGKVWVYPPLSGDISRPGWSSDFAVAAELRIRKR